MNRIRKIKGQSGFTLAETLLAVLILLLVSSIVATGIPVAQNVYEKVILGANAQVMLSTAVTALKGELGTAWDVEVEEDTSITYYSANTGRKSLIVIRDDSGIVPIKKMEYIQATGGDITFNSSAVGKEYVLVPDPSSRMRVICAGLDLDADPSIIVLSGIQVCLESTGSAIAELNGPLRIRLISGEAKSVPEIAGGE